MEITVRHHDTFSYYSQLFDLPLPLIAASNPTLSDDSLATGQVLHIPGYTTVPYTIQAGDTCWTLSQQRQLPLDQILLLNQTTISQPLQQGELILLPVRVRHMLITDTDQYSFVKFRRDIDRLLTVYPFLQKKIIGHSVLDKEMIELQIGWGSQKKHINGSFHANEWITTSIIMQFINQYLLALTNRLPLKGLDLLPYFVQNTLSLVPMVNPDGVDLVLFGAQAAEDKQNDVLSINQGNHDFTNWKANIHGVDLNNQFAALWEVDASRKPTAPSFRDFPGYQPLTEPEAIAMSALAQHHSFDIMNALHTQGQEFYWGYQGLEPAAAHRIASEYQRVSGYKSVQYVDSFAGYKDWFIQEFQKPGFTIELGLGMNPLPIRQSEQIYQDMLGIFLATLYL
ncbi:MULTISPECIES: M14 family metallopeptidase [Gracilibacillus]|uniref:M14 family metallopeptidase n=1 Tax=Gracilibacillus TaxID=74385 RepID=UPI0008261ECE|nr:MULTISPECIES: M14 family metallopeptidase [Gracilibacillus]